jgi:DNA polymerase I-like protein with 3'-5' exonuclease and polymerase domains
VEKIPEEQAKAEQAAFRKAWPGVYQWQKAFGSRSGEEENHWYTESFVGRIRYVGQKKDKRTGAYSPNYCDRLNGPIQAGGADMLYLALQKLLEDPVPGVEILITKHDEIVLEVSHERAHEAETALYERMKEALRELIGERLATEDCVEVETGPSWGGA